MGEHSSQAGGGAESEPLVEFVPIPEERGGGSVRCCRSRRRGTSR